MNENDNWPKHPDGTRKKMREMTKDEQKSVLSPVLSTIKKELESPEMKKAFED